MPDRELHKHPARESMAWQDAPALIAAGEIVRTVVSDMNAI
jgi:hypothetical protein